MAHQLESQIIKQVKYILAPPGKKIIQANNIMPFVD
jgi:hypothetical protein